MKIRKRGQNTALLFVTNITMYKSMKINLNDQNHFLGKYVCTCSITFQKSSKTDLFWIIICDFRKFFLLLLLLFNKHYRKSITPIRYKTKLFSANMNISIDFLNKEISRVNKSNDGLIDIFSLLFCTVNNVKKIFFSICCFTE